MADFAQIPIAKCKFTISLQGIPILFAQKITFPEVTFGTTEYHNGTRKVKFPSGTREISDLTLEGVMFDDTSASQFVLSRISKLLSLQNFAPEQIFENCQITMNKPNSLVPARIFNCKEVFLKSRKISDLETGSNDPVMETLVFSVGDFEEVST